MPGHHAGENAEYFDKGGVRGAVCIPVVVGAVFAFPSFVGDRVNDVLGVRAYQFDRVNGEVLVQVGTALRRIWAQVTLILPLL